MAGAGHEDDRRLARVTSISSSGQSTSPEPLWRLSTAMAAAELASPADAIEPRKAETRKEELGPTQRGAQGRRGRGIPPELALEAPSPTRDEPDTYGCPGTPEYRPAVTVLCAPTRGLSLALGRSRAVDLLKGGVPKHTPKGAMGRGTVDTSPGSSPGSVEGGDTPPSGLQDADPEVGNTWRETPGLE